MNFRPCIDLHQGSVRQIIGTTLTNKLGPKINFTTDKSVEWFVDLYKQDNLIDGHIVLLGEGNEKVALRAIKRWQSAFQVGGQMNEENAQHWLDQGAKKIIFTSWIIEKNKIHWNRLERLAKKLTPQKIVLDLSCQKFKEDYYIMTEQWKNKSNHLLSLVTPKLADYCSEFLVHATSVEGSKQGIEKDLVTTLAKYKKPKEVTYAGGIARKNDIEYIIKVSKAKLFFTIGSALDIFGGNISYRWLVDNLKKKNINTN